MKLKLELKAKLSKLLRKSLFTPSNSNKAAICRPTQLKRLQFGFFKRNMNLKISSGITASSGKCCSLLPSCGHTKKPSRVRRSLN